MRRTSKRQPQRSTTTTQKLLTAGLVVVFLMIAGVAALLVFDRVREMIAASTSLPELAVSQPAEETPVVQFDPLQLPQWTGVERVNILLLGIDQRDYEEGPWRTDTMIVLTIDPVTMTGGVLSIPRDLWVPIPGYNEARINTAHYFGDVYDYPGGGPALAVQTVEYNLGVPIHYYVRANFTAFEKIVDLIGGIDVVVPEEINDPKYPDRNSPGYDPLYIPAGRQHLDGEMALKYARTRYSLGADFDRAKRQQQVLDAILYRVTSLDMLPDLALKAPQLWQTLEGAVETDLSLEQIIALANLASEIEPEARRYGVINEKYTQNWTTPDGQQVLIPLRDSMREMRDYIFTTQPVAEEIADPATRLSAEAATIAVLNGTAREGLAGSTAEYLLQQGLDVVLTDNADLSDYVESMVIVYTGKTYTAEYITRLLGLPQTAVVLGSDPTSEVDISVVLGANFVPVATEAATPTDD